MLVMTRPAVQMISPSAFTWSRSSAFVPSVQSDNTLPIVCKACFHSLLMVTTLIVGCALSLFSKTKTSKSSSDQKKTIVWENKGNENLPSPKLLSQYSSIQLVACIHKPFQNPSFP